MSWLAGDADSSSFRKWDKPIVSRQGRTWAQKMRHEESLSTVLVQTWTEYDKRKVCCLVMVVLVKRTRFALVLVERELGSSEVKIVRSHSGRDVDHMIEVGTGVVPTHDDVDESTSEEMLVIEELRSKGQLSY
ncbi:MAG: hypothetical protein A3D24_02800 [Candidatus Blackburnbacteria bacterium RIFCSPHIGHO2_02_FULL_39_13]|uniref:Uncharacterized protein n=1 Tax=Candidatus Blackburnbacteria bacterium RIFCSPLOWO2_01_FULL_40_20 TaxID=1797519 RepID=A0A1G1VBV8_9BACT|nr:MAG: hypothetical protein A2694_01705 [Candidatus Blackburnbacteria bacterium RIFCSPHIGHO2_01_FULL_40_17]OGY07752.1 MAG: hypothetical protein A3D24_02800 [Candidatus Blackburnbacteria bacterium RIFCSPHIGHO2_02_FULL_39_13]OGY12811.1 MAG: hypothetical protein A3A77_02965 [Candidatus Blackburnbacteria bacterium RIFCSPLOWO2_01_FULL_40_20]